MSIYGTAQEEWLNNILQNPNYSPAQKAWARQQYAQSQQQANAGQGQQASGGANGMAQGAGMVGQAGGMYAANSLMGGGSAAAGTTAATGTGAAAGTGATAAGTTAAGTAGTSTAGTAAASSVGSVALPVLAAIYAGNRLWEDGGKDILRGRADKRDWTNTAIDSMGGVMINHAFQKLTGKSIGARLASGKGEDQQIRDLDRKAFKGKLFDDKYQYAFEDGSSFDMGKDGGARLTNDAGEKRTFHDVDFGNKLAGQTVAWLDPLAAISNEGRTSFTGTLTNAALSNAKDIGGAKKNALDMYAKMGLDRQKGIDAISQMVSEGRLDQARADSYRNSLNTLFGGGGVDYKTKRGNTVNVDAGTAKRWRLAAGKK